MDSSSVQSSAKCSSDFSIERILSSAGRKTTDDVEVPNWLCCTRYRPPRLPRAVGNSGGRVRRSGRHARVPFTAAQAAALEAAYARAPYLAPPALRALAAALQLRDDRIKIWFQNRRARERREKCGNIAPPVAVTLPATTSAHVSIMPSCPWNSSSQTFNLSAVQNEGHMIQSTPLYSRDRRNLSVSPSSVTTDEDASDMPLDIESIED